EIVESSRSFDLCIDGSLPAPIIGKGEENVRPIRKDRVGTQRKAANKEQKGIEGH